LTSPHRTGQAIEDEIIAVRQELDRDGHESGAATIAFHLEQRHGSAPAVSTIWRILSQRGFISPQPHKRPKSSYLRFAAEQPNERWQADTTHWTLADGTDVEILTMLDDYSRFCLDSHTLRVFKGHDIHRRFQQTTARHGNPASLLTDNGAVFTGRSRGHGRVALEVTLHARGDQLPALPALPPADLRQGRALPPDPEKVARPTATGPYPAPAPEPSSTPSAATTTTCDHTEHSHGGPRRRPTPPDPKRCPSALRCTPATGASATTASTHPACSPCATTVGCTTSVSAAATPAPTSSSWSTT
jgi:hypothetical protein